MNYFVDQRIFDLHPSFCRMVVVFTEADNTIADHGPLEEALRQRVRSVLDDGLYYGASPTNQRMARGV